MRLKNLEINGFKSFSKKTVLEFVHPVVAIVGPNGSGKSNVVEAIRFVLGEQSMKSMRGKQGTDLIFKGSKSLPKGSSATVSIYFNNEDKVFKLTNEVGENVDLNFDTVSIGREVYSDGLNKYVLNGGEARLKDVNNLLASVNIGSSGHHIISQGEADRILNASIKDRKEMIEDALGLKVYQYKIKDAERKLERTEENMKEVSILRRENAPHLNFLKKQMEKYEKAKEMRIELSALYNSYLHTESIYLKEEVNKLRNDKERIEVELKTIEKELSQVEGEEESVGSEKATKLHALEKDLNEIHVLKNELERKLGRIEGMIEAEENRKKDAPMSVAFSEAEIRKIIEEIESSIDQATSSSNLDEVREILKKIKNTLNKFNQNDNSGREAKINEVISEFKDAENKVRTEIENIKQKEKSINEEIINLRKEIEQEIEEKRGKEKEKFTLKVKHQELTSAFELVSVKEANLSRETEVFENEIKEGGALLGDEIFSYKGNTSGELLDRVTQEENRRKIERIKIKLEDIGIGGEKDILKEFEEVSSRDEFLGKEMEDLTKSMESLKELILSLKNEIDTLFKEGVRKINKEFNEFFALMFGGGNASLSLVVEEKRKKRKSDDDEENDEEIIEEEEGEPEQGVDINVALPHKKVKELHALSGGERSLTSIALLFAMSQVNPPPFLVLDETDAALDEANSRKYGDMIEKLSKHSQLIVVTHNRETMSRAGVLYGVTIGSDGASKLLSVKFEEAQAIAK